MFGTWLKPTFCYDCKLVGKINAIVYLDSSQTFLFVYNFPKILSQTFIRCVLKFLCTGSFVHPLLELLPGPSTCSGGPEEIDCIHICVMIII